MLLHENERAHRKIQATQNIGQGENNLLIQQEHDRISHIQGNNTKDMQNENALTIQQDHKYILLVITINFL